MCFTGTMQEQDPTKSRPAQGLHVEGGINMLPRGFLKAQFTFLLDESIKVNLRQAMQLIIIFCQTLH